MLCLNDAMTVYYTGKGDKGSSTAIGSASINKDDPLFDILGNLDELNSILAVCSCYVADVPTKTSLGIVQDNLFSISAIIANSYNKTDTVSGKLEVPDTRILEESINEMSKELPELKKFVIPGGCKAASYLHVARSIARKTERRLVSFHKTHNVDERVLAYVNRLSSFLFVAALYLNHKEDVNEKNPTYS